MSQALDMYSEERHQLVHQELSPFTSNPAILDALENTPRHLFVPHELQAQAYLNRALAIGHGQTISQPQIVTMMTDSLHPTPSDKVLEIGTGSGYQAAVLSHLVAEVYTIELVESLAKKTCELFAELQLRNIHCRIGDGSFGWREHAPYDSIIVTAAPDKIPLALIEQLKEGGRLAIPLGSTEQRLKLFRKLKGELIEQDLGAVRFVPMLGEVFRKE